MTLIHFSCKELKKVRDMPEQYDGWKPQGLWFATNDAWIKYYAENLSRIQKDCKYMYELEVDYTDLKHKNKNKVLKITNEDEFDKFMLKYGFVEKYDRGTKHYFVLVKWSQVARDFGGFEIMELIKSRIHNGDPDVMRKYNKKLHFIDDNKIDDSEFPLFFWQYTLDVGSGCVWRKKAIKSIKRSYQF